MFKRLSRIFSSAGGRSRDVGGLDIDTLLRGMEARTGAGERTSAIPAWAMILRSPYATSQDATSWLGGLPKAPADFRWPRDRQGHLQHFFVQIDLSALKAEPETGMRPPGLPRDGALLVFAGEAYSCHLVPAAQMERAIALAPPAELPPVRQHGYFGEGSTFPHWPIDFIAYLDHTGERPPCLKDPFATPQDWIVNWGIAALEAEIVIETLQRELGFGADFEGFRQTQRAAGKPVLDNEVTRSKSRHYAQMRERAPALLSRLEAWRDLALSRDPGGAVDKAALEEILAERMALADDMQPYVPKLVLPGSPKEFWFKLRLDYPALDMEGVYSVLPSHYRPFITAMISDWRGHRLFGRPQAPPYNGEDLRGRDCLITIAADKLLNTESEHEHALSVWCPRKDMVAGRFDSGIFVRHSNG